MTEHFIEYQGKKYTPLEFSEMIADKLPVKYRGIVQSTAAGIKSAEQFIKDSDEHIAVAKEKGMTDLVAKFKKSKEDTLRYKESREGLLDLLLAMDEITSLIAFRAKREVEDLK